MRANEHRIYIMFKHLLSSSLLIAVCSASFAESQSNSEADQPIGEIQTSTWVAGLGFTKIEQNTVNSECVGSSSPEFHFNYTAQDGHFIYGGGMAIYLLDDNCKFSQDVIDGWGGRGRASSNASGLGLFGELGYSLPIEPRSVHFDLFSGFEHIWAERSISNCTNCYSENIDIDGGIYLKPQFKFIRESGFTITIGAKLYPNSEIDHSIFINFGKTNNIF